MQQSSLNAGPLPQAAPVTLSMQSEALACLAGKHASGFLLCTTCEACLHVNLSLLGTVSPLTSLTPYLFHLSPNVHDALYCANLQRLGRQT